MYSGNEVFYIRCCELVSVSGSMPFSVGHQRFSAEHMLRYVRRLQLYESTDGIPTGLAVAGSLQALISGIWIASLLNKWVSSCNLFADVLTICLVLSIKLP